MNKTRKIKMLHKVLWLKEDLDNGKIGFDSFYSYITDCLVQFSGIDMNEQLKDKIINTLKGIRVLHNELTHNDIRGLILGLMNDIDRGE